MLDHEFLDKWDMGRRIEARLFCFGSGSDDDSGGNAAEDIVTMGRGAPAQGGNVSGREEIAMNNLIDEMDMERRMSGVYGMNDSSGDRRLVNRNIENPMTTGFGPYQAQRPQICLQISAQTFKPTWKENLPPVTRCWADLCASISQKGGSAAWRPL